MKCERCGEIMVEDYISVRGGIATLKTVSVLRCTHCGRLEYRSADGVRVVTGANQRTVSG